MVDIDHGRLAFVAIRFKNSSTGSCRWLQVVRKDAAVIPLRFHVHDPPGLNQTFNPAHRPSSRGSLTAKLEPGELDARCPTGGDIVFGQPNRQLCQAKLLAPIHLATRDACPHQNTSFRRTGARMLTPVELRRFCTKLPPWFGGGCLPAGLSPRTSRIRRCAGGMPPRRSRHGREGKHAPRPIAATYAIQRAREVTYPHLVWSISL